MGFLFFSVARFCFPLCLWGFLFVLWRRVLWRIKRRIHSKVRGRTLEREGVMLHLTSQATWSSADAYFTSDYAAWYIVECDIMNQSWCIKSSDYAARTLSSAMAWQRLDAPLGVIMQHAGNAERLQGYLYQPSGPESYIAIRLSC